MKYNTVMLLLFFLIIITVGSSPGSELQLKRPVKVLEGQIPAVVSSQKVLRSVNRLMQSPGTILDSTYYDWQCNGGLDDHLSVQNIDGTVIIHGVMMIAYLEDTSDRCMNYYFWDGTKWDNPPGKMCITPSSRGGFGSLSQMSSGAVVIGTHNDNVGGLGTQTYVAYDSGPGLRDFSFMPADSILGLTWPHVSVNSDSSITLMASDGVDVFWTRAAAPESSFTEWTSFRKLEPNWMGNDMEPPAVHSGTNGMVGCVIPDLVGAIRFFESTDNGVSWTSITLAAADTAGLPAGLDSTAARLGWINSDITYIGDEPHVVWSAGQGAKLDGQYGLFDFKATIFHWSPSTGVDTVIVAWTQSADDSRDDYVPTPFNHLSVDWPSIGLAVDGRTLIVAFTAFNPDDIDSTGLPPAGYVDIWMTSSSDNGEIWTEPQNVTNPDGTILRWDDRYPSIAKVNIDNGADPGKDVYMIYQSDDLSGTFVQGTESAVNMDYIKFIGVDLSAVGIGDGGDAGSIVDIPKSFSLSQNFPNPFNPSTTIDYQVPDRSPVSIRVYDMRGRLVRSLVEHECDPGRYSVQWDGKDSSGRLASSGVYIYRMVTGPDAMTTKKMVVLK